MPSVAMLTLVAPEFADGEADGTAGQADGTAGAADGSSLKPTGRGNGRRDGRRDSRRQFPVLRQREGW